MRRLLSHTWTLGLSAISQLEEGEDKISKKTMVPVCKQPFLDALVVALAPHLSPWETKLKVGTDSPFLPVEMSGCGKWIFRKHELIFRSSPGAVLFIILFRVAGGQMPREGWESNHLISTLPCLLFSKWKRWILSYALSLLITLFFLSLRCLILFLPLHFFPFRFAALLPTYLLETWPISYMQSLPFNSWSCSPSCLSHCPPTSL